MDTLIKLMRLILAVVNAFELIKYEKGKNITAWRGMLSANSSVGYASRLTLISELWKKPIVVNLPAGFIPQKNRKEIKEYWLNYSKPDDKIDVTIALEFLGYTIASMFLGKPLAIVNAGRGKLILACYDLLKVKDSTLEIFEYCAGGDLTYNAIRIHDEIISLASHYNTCMTRIEKLGKNDAKVVDDVSVELKRNSDVKIDLPDVVKL